MSLTESEQHLLDQYARLRAAAQAVVDGATAAGDAERPLCAVDPWLIRDLRRELRHEPQPHSKLTWMSPT